MGIEPFECHVNKLRLKFYYRLIKFEDNNNLAHIFINRDYDNNVDTINNTAKKFSMLNMYLKLLKKYNLTRFIEKKNLPQTMKQWGKILKGNIETYHYVKDINSISTKIRRIFKILFEQDSCFIQVLYKYTGSSP